MDIAAIIVAAGRGTRAGGDLPKQWRRLHGRAGRRLDRRRLSCPSTHRPGGAGAASGRSRPGRRLRGRDHRHRRRHPRRQRRRRARSAGDDPPDLVLIHDVARPLVPAAVIDRVIGALGAAAGAAPALAVTDALWIGEAGRVAGTRDRSGLYRAQTPQGFRYAAILAAHRAHQAGALGRGGGRCRGRARRGAGGGHRRGRRGQHEDHRARTISPAPKR